MLKQTFADFYCACSCVEPLDLFFSLDRKRRFYRRKATRVYRVQQRFLDKIDAMVQFDGDVLDDSVCDWLPAHDHSWRCLKMVFHAVNFPKLPTNKNYKITRFCSNKNYLGTPICASTYNLVRYHLGSVAVGSFIIALVQFNRLILVMVQRCFKNKQDACTRTAMKCCYCCMYCLERILQYLNRNAYIEIGIKNNLQNYN